MRARFKSKPKTQQSKREKTATLFFVFIIFLRDQASQIPQTPSSSVRQTKRKTNKLKTVIIFYNLITLFKDCFVLTPGRQMKQ